MQIAPDYKLSSVRASANVGREVIGADPVGLLGNLRSRKAEGRVRPRFIEIIERCRRRQRRARDRMLAHELDTSGPALRQFLPANGRRGVRHRLDDLLRAGVRPVFRAGT